QQMMFGIPLCGREPGLELCRPAQLPGDRDCARVGQHLHLPKLGRVLGKAGLGRVERPHLTLRAKIAVCFGALLDRRRQRLGGGVQPPWPLPKRPEGFCRKVAFWRPNSKIGYWKINDLRASTFLFSVICDRAFSCAGPVLWLPAQRVWFRT